MESRNFEMRFGRKSIYDNRSLEIVFRLFPFVHCTTYFDKVELHSFAKPMQSDVPKRPPMSFRVEIFVVIPSNRYRFAQFHYKSDCDFVEMQVLQNSIRWKLTQGKIFIINYNIIIAI